jgi:hypothetical protein
MDIKKEAFNTLFSARKNTPRGGAPRDLLGQKSFHKGKLSRPGPMTWGDCNNRLRNGK